MRMALILGGIILAALAGAVQAQPRWEPFPPDQSALLLSAPDFPESPSRAEELKGGNPGIRTFLYTWGLPKAPSAYAQAIVNQIAQNEKFFVKPPDYPTLLRETFSDLAGGTFAGDERDVPAGLGVLKYRPLVLGSRQCLAFGSLFGVVPGGGFVTFQGGSAPQGDKWLYGYYCPPSGQTLTPEGARYVLEGFGWTGIGTAKPDRAKPGVITTRQ